MLSQLGADGTFHLPQLISSHRLVDDAADCIRCLPPHPLGGVGVGIQREPCAVVAQGIREDFHVYAVL